MAFSLLLALVVLMASGSGGGRRRAKTIASKRSRGEEPSSDSDSGSDYEQESGKGKGKETMPTTQKKPVYYPSGISTGGPVIREGSQSEARSQLGEGAQHHYFVFRRGLFEHRACIAERHVKLDELCREVPDFAILLERTPIQAVCTFPPKEGFCTELIREFYINGYVPHWDSDTGLYLLQTTVRGVNFDITPDVVAAKLGMVADASGVDYTWGTFTFNTHWDVVVNGICKPGTITNRRWVESKDLKPEYHILSLIISYNIMPTLGTKRIRWIRLLLLYFLGHPESARGFNVNIPFLICEHIGIVIRAKNSRSLLPFPILISRLLADHGVDMSCAKYDYGLGPIDAITLAKSISTLKTVGHGKGSASDSTPSAARRQVQRIGTSGAEGVVTVQSLHQDVRTLNEKIDQGFSRFDHMFQSLEDGLQKIFDFLRCKHDDVVPGATEPRASHVPTSLSNDGDDEGRPDES